MSTRPPARRSGAKRRDYAFTVLAVDPIAIPVTHAFARTRLSPDAVSLWALLFGIPIAFAFATGERWGLVIGAVLWYASFLLDCVDGKLARLKESTSDRGRKLDDLGDGARRASAVLGLVVYLWKSQGHGEAFVTVVFGILAFYVIEISGGEMSGPEREPEGRWEETLARFRLLPNPGMTDVSAVAFVFGPLTGLVFEGVVVALALTAAAVLRIWLKVMRSSG